MWCGIREEVWVEVSCEFRTTGKKVRGYIAPDLISPHWLCVVRGLREAGGWRTTGEQRGAMSPSFGVRHTNPSIR